MTLGVRMLRVGAGATLLLLLVLAAFALLRAARPEALEIRWITVSGPFERVTAEQVRASAAPALEGGFLAVDPALVREAVMDMAWIEDAEVEKDWPDTVRVRVREQRPLALWGADRLVSETGALFSVAGSRIPEGLPRLRGEDAEASAVVVFYQEMRRRLSGTGLDVEALERSPRGAWAARLTGGIELALGRVDPLARLERFVAALPALDAEIALGRELRAVDLRYTDGFAARWSDDGPDGAELAAAGGE